MKRVLLLNAACVLEILDLIFRARLASFVTTLPKQPNIFRSPVVCDLSLAVLGLDILIFSLT
jgi:hypothetical protein